MSGQVALPGELLVTLTTPVGLLTCVDVLVHAAVLPVPEGLGAVAAGEVLLTSVHTLVPGQVMPGGEPLAAVGAAEKPPDCMPPLVLAQRSLALEALAAPGARGRGLLHPTRGRDGMEQGAAQQDLLAPTWLGHPQDQGTGC